MGYYPFDSRNPLYREHIGAVAAGTPLRLRLCLHNDARVDAAFLSIIRDGEEENIIKMYPAETIDDYRFYECETTLTEGLYFYSFFYDSAYGRMYVTNTEGSLGTVSNAGKRWQQTVYTEDFCTPEWLKGGIIYQIFPDRFCHSGKAKTDVPEDRFLQKDWYAQPVFLNDGDKRIGNDYYGGDLAGIESRLSYLKSLGVNCIYLNPIFEAHSNHRYNTANYLKIDSLLGDERDLKSLCESAKELGIYIVLDGVFSHTGDDSIYFNKQGRYDSLGAFQSKDSPYYNWFNFKNWPHEYAAWWGIESLPETNENNAKFTEFITGKDGVLTHWMKCGIKGWRLDVADELPDEFIDKIRTAIKKKDAEAYLLGEVWEDATTKISYGRRRRFLRGRQLDSVMNYPLCDAIINYVKGGNARHLTDLVLTQAENYPKPALDTLMNHLGTHDTARILTRLGTDRNGDRNWQAGQKLSPDERRHALRLLRLAVALQYTLPGVPSVFYGDEAGVEGYGDPFCRTAYPYGREDTDLIDFYKKIGKIRRENRAFRDGEFIPHYSQDSFIIFERKSKNNRILIAVNRDCEKMDITLPKGFDNFKVLFDCNGIKIIKSRP